MNAIVKKLGLFLFFSNASAHRRIAANAQCRNSQQMHSATHHVDIGDADKRALAKNRRLTKLRTIQTDLDLHLCSNPRPRSHGQCHFQQWKCIPTPSSKRHSINSTRNWTALKNSQHPERQTPRLRDQSRTRILPQKLCTRRGGCRKRQQR